MTRRFRVSVASIALATALGACSSATKTPSTAPSESTTRPPNPTTTAAAPASSDELAGRLVTKVPAGFVLQADNVGDTGPSDLAKAIKDDGAPGAEAALRAERFVRGYQQLWVGPADSEIILFVYQFADATGARREFARDKTDLSDAPPGATTFSVAGLPVTYSDAIEGSAQGTSAAVVMFTTGVFNVQVICNGPVLAELRARVSAIALDQYKRLR